MTTDTTTTETSATHRAQHAASTATDETRHVAGVAAEEARSVASEATHQVRDLAGQAIGDVQSQVEDQTRQQKDKLAGTLAGFGDDLGSMAENRSGLAADVAHEVADRAQSLARHLDGREPRELIDDVRRFARERPGTFLLGAVAAGVVVGRLARSTKDAVEAADASADSELTAAPRVTPGAPNTSSVLSTHGQATQPPPVTSPSIAPSATPTTDPLAPTIDPLGPTS
jgi:hypothetical protein